VPQFAGGETNRTARSVNFYKREQTFLASVVQMVPVLFGARRAPERSEFLTVIHGPLKDRESSLPIRRQEIEGSASTKRSGKCVLWTRGRKPGSFYSTSSAVKQTTGARFGSVLLSRTVSVFCRPGCRHQARDEVILAGPGMVLILEWS
jgi:hypothetical protein